jgi:hypothetical protein
MKTQSPDIHAVVRGGHLKGLTRWCGPMGRLVLVVACLQGSDSAAGPLAVADSLRTWAELQEAIQRVEPGRDRGVLFFEFLGRIEDGRIDVRAGRELDDLVAFLVSRMESPDEHKVVRIRIADFLWKNPHPAAADALWRAATTGDAMLGERARRALVALREERVLDLLLEDVRQVRTRGSGDAFRMIGELGSPHAIEPLERILADSTIEEEMIAALRQQQRELGRDPENRRIAEQAAGYAREYREGARRALRDVRLRVEAGIVTPFDLDDHAHAALAREGFVVLPELANELYEHLGTEYPYVTVDVVFHAFMILARSSFDDLERLVLRPKLRAFAANMERGCLARVSHLRPEREVRLAYRNAAVFALVGALLDGGEIEATDLPREAAAAVREELAAIRAHERVAPSRLFDVREDFTKYRPRGRHGEQPDLRSYFQAMLYLGRMKFRIEDEAETRRALLLLDVLESDPELRRQWVEIDELLGLFFGRLDDPGVREYERLLRRVAPDHSQGLALAVSRDRAAFESFRVAVRSLPAPRILTLVPDSADPGSRESARGFRIFGQRATRAIDVFQQWMEGSAAFGAPSFPSGLHVASALLGSDEAERILRSGGRPATAEVVSMPEAPGDPLRDLPEGYLHGFRPLFEESPDRPAFMRGPAWERRLINSALGAWAEVVHATMLYTKDANIYMGISGMLDRFHGYVDPYPEFYSRLSGLTDRFVASLEECGLFDRMEEEIAPLKARLAELPQGIDAYKERTRLQESSIRATREMYAELSGLLPRLEEIARKELRGEAQSVADGMFLKSLRRKFQRLAFNWSNSDHHRESMALVTDPATEYSTGRCLEVGIGRPLAMYVAVPFEGSSFVCRGPIYSYYEFLRPIEDRLDDETWRRLSRDLDEPDRLPWMARFPDLGLARRASRAELDELLGFKRPDGRNSYGGWEPWRASRYDDPTSGLATARVAEEDIDLLFRMADRDTIHLGVRAFALQKLKRFGARSDVLEAYRRQLTLAGQVGGSSSESNLVHVRLYHAIQGLGYCGKSAIPELDRAKAILEATRLWTSGAEENVEPYRVALGEARLRIAEHPQGFAREQAPDAPMLR